jgi:hypothetical protein
MANRRWPVNTIPSHAYRCGWCHNQIASNLGEIATDGNSNVGAIYICSHCGEPTYFKIFNGIKVSQTPGGSYGNPVLHVPEPLNTLYEEARRDYSHNAYTSTVLVCRKILMHVAVDKESTLAGKSFKECVDWLGSSRYTPPGADKWIDKIRKKGNEANHEINIMEQTSAAELITYCEMLLKLIYEFPNRT